MEIIRGSLDNISRPASSEQTGSRVSSVSLPHRDRICPTTPFSLVVLSSDAADIQIHSSSKETTASSPISSVSDPGKDECHTVTTEEEDEDSRLQRAIEEMRRLDEILSAKICREKEIQRQRKELQAKLWQELRQNRPESHSECAHEALNTKLFLALEAPTGTDEEDDFVPVFETEVSECEQHRDNQHLEQSEKKPDSLTDSFEVGYKDKAEFEGSHCGASKGMNKQKDFVKRNIELVNGEGGQVFLTQAEKERLTELLREIDEEEEDSARGADSEGTMWAVSVLTDQGYTPEPSDLEQLIDIDSKIHHLHPDQDFYSYTSSYTNLSMSQCVGRVHRSRPRSLQNKTFIFSCFCGTALISERCVYELSTKPNTVVPVSAITQWKEDDTLQEHLHHSYHIFALDGFPVIAAIFSPKTSLVRTRQLKPSTEEK